MMKVIHVAAVVLSLLSVGQSAPVSSCETLIRPRETNGTEQLLGTWTYIAESTNLPSSKLLTKMIVEGSRVKVTAANESDTLNLLQTQKSFGRCFSLTYKMTMKGSTLTSAYPLPFSTTSTLLNTGCSDCHVFYANFTTGGRTYYSAQLMSKRNKVDEAELEEFTKQVECLNLPAPAIVNSEKGFCSDASQETEVTDLTQAMSGIGSDALGLIDTIFNSEGGVQSLLEMISANEAGSKLQ